MEIVFLISIYKISQICHGYAPIVNVFTFGQFNVSLLNKYIDFILQTFEG